MNRIKSFRYCRITLQHLPDKLIIEFMKKNHIVLKNIVLLLFGTVAGLIIAEAALRIVGFSAPVFREPHPVLGWRGTADLKGSHRIENVTYNSFNRMGYHDREHSRAKPEGTWRIAIVGDSFVQASEVTLDHHFATLLEKELNKRMRSFNRNVEIINFGVSGYSTAQELILLRNEVREYRPDIVVLMVYPGNDIIDNSYALSTTLRDMRPYFTMNMDNSLALTPGYPNTDKIFRDALLVKIINSSRLLQLSKEAFKRLSVRKSAGSEQAENKKKPEDDLFSAQHSQSWEKAWDITERLLAAFAEETKASGADFLMAIAAVPIQVHPLESERIGYMRSLNVKTLDYPTLRLSAFAQRSGISYISLVKPFSDLSSTGVYLHGFDERTFGEGHWNEKGHQLVAELLSQKISAEFTSNRLSN